MIFANSEQVSLIGSFREKDLELSYQTHSFSKFKKNVIPIFTVVLISFILFCLPDMRISPNADIFVRNMVLRLSAVVLFIIFYFIVGRSNNFYSYLLLINVMEISFIFFYMLILSGYINMNFPIKCMDIIIIVTLYFSFPNKWINSFLISLILILSFAVFCACNTAHFTQDRNYLAGSVYIAIAFLLNAFNSYRTNYYKRSQYYRISVLKRLINTDKLTGAFTRAKFDEDIKNQISISVQTDSKFSITIFDIDDFKHINDTYGHIEGDEVITGIANVVTKNKRPKDILTRWGGEEFVIIFPSTGLSAAVKITERLRYMISSKTFSIGEQVTCSFGVTEFEQGDTPISMMRRADKLMYDAKSSGKNIVTSDM